jgi:serine/threonine protein phosphatase PrpC/uncharacterized protein involved in tolerance to divalent cations
MVKDTFLSQWSCTGKSVRGAAHDRSGLPNQDAIDWYQHSAPDNLLILSVSDGHGSAKSFRSDRGSQFAVSTAIDTIRTFLSASKLEGINASSPKNMEDVAERRLKQQLTTQFERLTNRWIDRVRQDLAAEPFTDAEKKKLIEQDGEKGLKSIEDNPLLAYGATLLAVAIAESFIIYFQLGDGDILRVSTNGETTKPLTRDSHLIGNETTSLCMERSDRQFKFEVEFVTQDSSLQMPALILLATDGYSNSYPNDKEFFKVGLNYLNEIRENGIESVDNQLEDFLTGISSGGSGDDITLGIASRVEIDREPLRKRQASVANSDRDLSNSTIVNQNISSVKKNTNLISKLLAQKLAIGAAVLVVASTCLNIYLWNRSIASDEQTLAVTKNYENIQEKIGELERKVTQLEAKQNSSKSQQPSTKDKKKTKKSS